MKKNRIKSAFIFLLVVLISSSCGALEILRSKPSPKPPEKCIHGRPREDCFPFYALQSMAQTRNVTIFGDAIARSVIARSYIEAAVAKWNNACDASARTGDGVAAPRYMPHFLVDWEHERSPKDDRDCRAYRTEILITLSRDEEPVDDPQEGNMRISEWSRADNSIKIWGKCGHKHLNLPCEKVNNSIIWASAWGSMVVAHEIGHALGLWHDLPGCSKRGLMRVRLDKDDVGLPVLPEYCRFAEDMSNENSGCNKLTSSDGKNPCDEPVSGNVN